MPRKPLKDQDCGSVAVAPRVKEAATILRLLKPFNRPARKTYDRRWLDTMLDKKSPHPLEGRVEPVRDGRLQIWGPAEQWKNKEGTLETDQWKQADVLKEVQESVETLRDAVQEQLSRAAINMQRDAARNIIAATTALEEQIRSAPAWFRLCLEYNVVGLRGCRLQKDLEQIRSECRIAEKEYGLGDHRKRWSAQTAWNLMQKFSADRPSIKRGPFLEIARLIFQAVTHEQKKMTAEGRGHLRRACKDVIHEMTLALRPTPTSPRRTSARRLRGTNQRQKTL
jgi:hypothetical protein